MKLISEILTPDHIVLGLEASDKFNVISMLVDALSNCPQVIDREQFTKDIIRREEDFPTGLENGTALPHARTTAVKDLIMAFGRTKTGVNFGAPDRKPSRLVFLFGVPRDEIRDYLRTIAQLSRLLKEDRFRRKLMTIKAPERILAIIGEYESKLPKPIA
jgi:PTS system fructose-specific IIC component